ncbi:MAG TPA: ribonuclease P protein component [Rudaea sp.]|nr:ribonuclease P protein component [Rudaea sp.]
MAARFGHPPLARLREAADFLALRREGKRIASPCFHAQYRLTETGHARLGMAVSRRVSKHAVVRNRIRRIIRESFRVRRGALPDCNILLIARSEAAARSRAELRTDLESIWQRLAALKPREATRTIPPRS